MVIRPTIVACLGGMFAVGLHDLDVMHTHHGRQSAIMAIRIAQRLTCIMDAVVGVKQSVNNAFWCLENGAVLVQYRHFHLLRNILKFHEVFGEMGTKVLQAITVVVYQPTTIHFAGRRTFHHLASEGL